MDDVVDDGRGVCGAGRGTFEDETGGFYWESSDVCVRSCVREMFARGREGEKEGWRSYFLGYEMERKGNKRLI